MLQVRPVGVRRLPRRDDPRQIRAPVRYGLVGTVASGDGPAVMLLRIMS